MRTDTMLFVADVEASSRWYQEFLGMQSGHGGAEFEMLMDDDTPLLQLHRLSADHDHGVRTDGALGNGVVVFVHVEDVDAAHARAVELGIDVVEAPHENELAGMRECTVRDPDGYTLTLCKSRWG